ncbi:MAG TPA: TIGR03621 family F420-dependent LLM class oxidoreductase [Candidatus Dormibacteraeota bacterium]
MTSSEIQPVSPGLEAQPERARPFQFFFSASGVPARLLTDVARRAEALGFDGMFVADHLRNMLGPIAVMAHVSAVTERLRVGVAVMNNDLRHPAVAAQELAAIDQLSGGRLIVGLGAGWAEPEYRQAGLRYDPPGVRIDRLEEALAIYKGMFQGPVDLVGKYYQVTGFAKYPRTIQQPYPPFFIGGGGRRLLRLAAREAQLVGISLRAAADGSMDLNNGTATATDEKVGWVREVAGPRMATRDLHTHAFYHGAMITDDARGELRRLSEWQAANLGHGLSEAELMGSPHVFIGSVESVAEKLIEIRDRWGINCLTLDEVEGHGRPEQFEPVMARLTGR